jgi:hypothetical protein
MEILHDTYVGIGMVKSATNTELFSRHSSDKRLRKAIKNLIYDSWFPGRQSEMAPGKYKLEEIYLKGIVILLSNV